MLIGLINKVSFNVHKYKWRGRMLILSRKYSQSINIGDTIKITVLGCARGQVKFGIEAPDDIKIWREEIYRKIQEEREIQKLGKPINGFG
jgi:carbon storage regulator